MQRLARSSIIPVTRESRHHARLFSSLVGKKAVITGGSRGIGLAIAQRFSAEGAECVLVGRAEETLQKAVQQLKPLGSEARTRHSYAVGDVGVREFWSSLAKQKANILVNAAGLAQEALFMATKPEALEQIIQTNLMGTVWSTHTIVRDMIRRREGCIINVSSLLAVKGGRGAVSYATSKAGVLGLTRSLATEVGQANVRVNAILPGYIETKMTDDMNAEARSQALNAIPLRRFGTPDEVAHAATFLATNDYATNCVLNLDGGLSGT